MDNNDKGESVSTKELKDSLIKEMTFMEDTGMLFAFFFKWTEEKG